MNSSILSMFPNPDIEYLNFFLFPTQNTCKWCKCESFNAIRILQLHKSTNLLLFLAMKPQRLAQFRLWFKILKPFSLFKTYR